MSGGSSEGREQGKKRQRGLTEQLVPPGSVTLNLGFLGKACFTAIAYLVFIFKEKQSCASWIVPDANQVILGRGGD